MKKRMFVLLTVAIAVLCMFTFAACGKDIGLEAGKNYAAKTSEIVEVEQEDADSVTVVSVELDREKYFQNSSSVEEITTHTHNNAIYFKGQEPDCVNSGNIEYWYCADCGKYFKEKSYTTAITLQDTVVAAKGHSLKERINNLSEATCTVAGAYEKTVYCETCGEDFGTVTGSVAPLGHTYEDVDCVDASCEKAGYVFYECSRCGEGYFEEEEARGHSYGETGECSVCGAADPNFIPEHEHIYDIDRLDSVASVLSAPVRNKMLAAALQGPQDPCVCKICGARAHTPDAGGTCTQCGQKIHSSDDSEAVHNFDENCVCTVCGLIRHELVDFVCTECGRRTHTSDEDETQHVFVNCRCIVCEEEGPHTLDENCVCTVCGRTKHNVGSNCKCTKCEKTVHKPNENCVCTVCGETIHNLKDCVCTKCGATKHTPNENCLCTACGAEAHILDENCVCTVCEATFHKPDKNCVCAICNKTVHILDENCKCSKCGAISHNKDAAGKCTACGKTVHLESDVNATHTLDDHCVCTVCGKIAHNLNADCVCTVCGETAHVLDENCYCTVCEKNKHILDTHCKCTRCGGIYHTPEADGNCASCGQKIHSSDDGSAVHTLDDHCVCTVCGIVAHKLNDNCVCTVCESEAHALDENCECTKCKKSFHKLNGCICSVCKKAFHTLDADCECLKCGEISHGLDDDYFCAACGKFDHLEEMAMHGYCRHGDYIYFGTYPQSKVNNVKLIEKLSSSVSWTSYGYYCSGNVKTYMKYADREYNGKKYRGVYFSQYRPFWTTDIYSAENSRQDDSGYYVNTVYWFRYEPVKWRVISEKDGEALLLCEMIIDSQQYDFDGKYNNNYSESTVRNWLNDTFYNTAFTDMQKSLIKTVSVDNSIRSTKPKDHVNDSVCTACGAINRTQLVDEKDITSDKIFLLSHEEATDSNYGMNGNIYRQKKGSNYAVCQGLRVSDGYGSWWLRSPHCKNSICGFITDGEGCIDYSPYVMRTDYGIVPALIIEL